MCNPVNGPVNRSAEEKPGALAAMLRARCPHCRRGAIFASFMNMHKTCSHCHTRYEREHGYFLMAIFVGYLINGVIFAPIVLYFYITNRLGALVIPLILAILALAPLTFRYARVLWMYLDEALDPRRE